MPDAASGVAIASLVVSAGSLLGGGYLCFSCAPSIFRSDAAATTTQHHKHVVRAILLMVGVADSISAANWIATQINVLAFAGAESIPYCVAATLVGTIGLNAMSAWTAMLARQLYAALTLRSATSLGVYEHTAGWGVPLVLAVLVAPEYVATCSAGTPPFRVALLLEYSVPGLASLYVAVQYFRIRHANRDHFRVNLLAHATAFSQAGATTDGSQRSSRTLSEEASSGRSILAFKLDMRLLSYLIAYVACQLPALPALAAMPHDFGQKDTDTYLHGEAVPLVAVRVLAQSAQGLVNALVFMHHARHDRTGVAAWSPRWFAWGWGRERTMVPTADPETQRPPVGGRATRGGSPV